MVTHPHPTDCINTLNYTNEWETITFGAYRYVTCSECGREFNEYYTYEQLETTEEIDGEKIIIQQR